MDYLVCLLIWEQTELWKKKNRIVPIAAISKGMTNLKYAKWHCQNSKVVQSTCFNVNNWINKSPNWTNILITLFKTKERFLLFFLLNKWNWTWTEHYKRIFKNFLKLKINFWRIYHLTINPFSIKYVFPFLFTECYNKQYKLNKKE